MIKGRVYSIVLIGVLSFICCACSGTNVARGMALSAQPAEITPLPTHSINTFKHIPPTSTSTKVPVEKPLGLLKIPSSKAVIISPTPAHLLVQTAVPSITVCSPLQDFPLDKLPKIVSDPYDPPPMGSDSRHQGVDFVYHRLAGTNIPILGVQVNSVLPGIVAASLVDTFPYGNLVMVETPGSWLPKSWLDALGMSREHSLYLLYAHLQEKPLVKMGEELDGCQPIGKVGSSGNTEAAHLHLETRIGPSGSFFPSMYGLLKEAPEEARKNYNLWRTSGVYQHFDPMFLLLGLK